MKNNINEKICKAWRKSWTLYRIAKSLSSYEGWSEYYSLCVVLDYLHNKRGVNFSRKQVRYAFSKISEEEVPPVSKKEAWRWLLHLGGFTYARGRKKQKNFEK